MKPEPLNPDIYFPHVATRFTLPRFTTPPGDRESKDSGLTKRQTLAAEQSRINFTASLGVAKRPSRTNANAAASLASPGVREAPPSQANTDDVCFSTCMGARGTEKGGRCSRLNARLTSRWNLLWNNTALKMMISQSSCTCGLQGLVNPPKCQGS